MENSSWDPLIKPRLFKPFVRICILPEIQRRKIFTNIKRPILRIHIIKKNDLSNNEPKELWRSI